MKVLLVNKYWYLRGGAERVAFVTKDLLEKAGHEVEIFGMNHPHNIFKNDYFVDHLDYRSDKGVKKLKSVCKTIYNKQAKNKFERLIRDFEPDIVHFHNIYHQLSFSLLDVTKAKKIPTVMSLHDYKMISPNYSLYHHGKIDNNICKKGYHCLFNNCMENWLHSLVAVIEANFRKWKKYKNYIDSYISPSNFLKSKFVDCGWDKNIIDVVNNPIEISKAKSKVGDYVAFVGRLSPEKGIGNLFEVASGLSHIPFKIIGDGPLRIELERKVKNSNIKNIDIVGYKSGKELLGLMSGARFLVVPSVWYENYPMSVLEAKALSKIVLANKIGGLSEMLPKEMLVSDTTAETWKKEISKWYKKTDEELAELGKKMYNEVQKNNNQSVYLDKIISIYNDLIKR